MHAAAPGHDDSPDASRRGPNPAHKHPLSGRPRPTIEPPELRDVVAFSVQFDSHNEPQLAVVHQADLLSPRAVAPPDGRYSTSPVPVPESASKLAPAGDAVPTVRHYTATLHEIVEPQPAPLLAAPGVAAPVAAAAPRASRVPLAAAGVVVAAALFGYLLGRQQPVIAFANLPPTGAGPSAKAAMGPGPTLEVPAVPAAATTPVAPTTSVAPTPTPTPATALVPAPTASPAPTVSTPAAPATTAPVPATATVAAPEGLGTGAATLANPSGAPTGAAAPALARSTPDAQPTRPARAPREAAPAAPPTSTTQTMATTASPSAAAPAAAARVAATPLPMSTPIETPRPAPAPTCTENVAALGLCTLKP